MKRSAEIVVGLAYGDEGKGTTVDWLTRLYSSKLVVRFNGGAQAGHNVVLPDGKHHTFSQFGSGTLAGAETYLSRFVLVNPISALSEAEALEKIGLVAPLSTLHVDEDAAVTTPFQVAANRIRERARGPGRHGSCGMGIGETMEDLLDSPADALRVRDLLGGQLPEKLKRLREMKFEQLCSELDDRGTDVEWSILTEDVDDIVRIMKRFAESVEIVGRDWFVEQMRAPGTTLFEGAQGVLLDQDYGFHPHTTWSDCTFDNALELLDDCPDVEVCKVGVLRHYYTRHGAGPFVTESDSLKPLVLRDHNHWGRWQDGFRVGTFDFVAARYAIDVVDGVDRLMVTNLDSVRGSSSTWVCPFYEGPSRRDDLFVGRGSVWTSIAVGDPPTLERQQRVTRALSEMRPHNVLFPVNECLPQTLAALLGVAQVSYSWGATYKSKSFVI